MLPQVSLESVIRNTHAAWQSRRTLLNSDAGATDFVVEVDDDGRAWLRFGDDEHGLRPNTGTSFTATYRVGNGGAGNVGGEAIVHVVATAAELANIASVRNPRPASGGVDPESAESVRRNAPEAFRHQERAVTPEDYAAVTERHSGVQRAATTTALDRELVHRCSSPSIPKRASMRDAARCRISLPFVDRYRMAGHDLEFNDPRYVSLEIELHVCVQPDYFRAT